MIIKTLTVENFRKFERQGFRFNSRFNVLIGRNATGKTQVLDAIALILSVYTVEFLRQAKPDRSIKKSDVRIEQTPYRQEDGSLDVGLELRYPVSVSSQILYRNQIFNQKCSKESEDSHTTFGRSTDFSLCAKQEFQQVVNRERLTLPFLGYYGTGRLKTRKQEHRRPPEIENSRTMGGYIGVLNPDDLHNDLEEWIEAKNLEEFRNKRQSTDLEIVRQALKQTISNCQDIYYNTSLQRVCLKYEDGTSEPLRNLSDGRRCMVRMVADIARRIAAMNAKISGVKAIDETPGVVLIDEIDLYLHPKWQRSVVDDLKRAFPKLQFIVTTHSPFIIQSLNPGELIHLEKCDGQVYSYGETPLLENDDENENAEPCPDGEYFNRSPEDITEDVMGLEVSQWSQRRLDMYNAAQEYYKLLNNGEGVSPERKKKLKDELDALRKRFGTDNGDIAYYAFLDMERLAKESE